MAYLTIRNLSKTYEVGTGKEVHPGSHQKNHHRSQKSLNKINLEIHSGEFIVLVGPSGCGKSTLLRTIAGLEQPSEGDIEVNGKRINDLHPSERGLALVFQDYALYPHMSVRENMAFGLKMKKIPLAVIAERITQTSAMLKLDALLDRKPGQLSGGQRQRVAIGRALVKEPALFLLDEPLSNLDTQLRVQTRLEIAALHRRIGSTTLYVTHDQEEAMTLADRIAVLNRGEVNQFGSPMELYHQPNNQFVASFIGNPKMNLMKGEVLYDGSNPFFAFSNQRISLHRAQSIPPPGPYTLGIRPEAVTLGEGIQTHLVWIERFGFEIHGITQIEDQSLVFRTSEPQEMIHLSQAQPGLPIFLCFDVSQIHWFKQDADGSRVQERELIPLKTHSAGGGLTGAQPASPQPVLNSGSLRRRYS